MRFYILIAFFSLIVLAAAQAGHGDAHHGGHGGHLGAQHGFHQQVSAGVLPPNGTHASDSNNSTTPNSTTEASNSGSSTSTTEATHISTSS